MSLRRMLVRSFTPKPPCSLCGCGTLVGEPGRWYVQDVDHGDGSSSLRALWTHMRCLVAAGVVVEQSRRPPLELPGLVVPLG